MVSGRPRPVQSEVEHHRATGDDGEGRPKAPDPNKRTRWTSGAVTKPRVIGCCSHLNDRKTIEPCGDHRRYSLELGCGFEAGFCRSEIADGGHGVRRHIDHIGWRRGRYDARCAGIPAGESARQVLQQPARVCCLQRLRRIDGSPITASCRLSRSLAREYQTRATFVVESGRPGAQRS